MKILVISGSSEIGQACIKKFSKNNEVYYTYNTTKIKNINATGFYLDISKQTLNLDTGGGNFFLVGTENKYLKRD